MRVLYDHQIFTYQKYGGISRYFCEIYSHLKKYNLASPRISVLYSENAYYQSNLNKKYFTSKDYPGKLTGIKFVNEYYSRIHLVKGNFDVFHPTYYDTYFLRWIKRKPFVITIYDMIHEIFPQFFSSDDFVFKNKQKLIDIADRVITISNNTKNDIVRYFNVDESKIDIIYLANSLKISKYPPGLRLPSQYILFVGDRHHYKNFAGFVTAITPLLKGSSPLHLVCAGGQDFSPEEVALLKKLSIWGKVLKYPITDESLYHLYNNAICFVFPSLYEGFGIPVLESFFSGCPAVLSNGGSLPEIGGQAAVYFDPLDLDSIHICVKRVVMDEQLRMNMRELGYERVKKFTWEEAARKTRDVYQKAIEDR
ncbi:MAG: glycosyltransferase family 4 protein [Methanolinea sp.]|nr:glycosyltransferase family 4 protein [Methanolinea sp.]